MEQNDQDALTREIERFKAELPDQLEPILAERRPVEVLGEVKTIIDATRKYLVRRQNGRPWAVVSCSAPGQPDLVTQSAERARLAKEALGAELGAPVISPLGHGTIGDQSFVVLPYYTPLWESGPRWWLQRAHLRPRLFDWLTAVTRQTLAFVPEDQIRSRVISPLEDLLTDNKQWSELRKASDEAIERARAGTWSPRQVLQHDDFWAGNVLIDQETRGGRWFGDFSIIDWPGARVDGYPMYDFLRMAVSIGLTGGPFFKRLDEICSALNCNRDEALYEFSAAGAELGRRLGNWPVEAYRDTLEQCVRRILHGN